jgi:hypothetical protein
MWALLRWKGMRGGLNAGNGLESEALPKQMRIMYPGSLLRFFDCYIRLSTRVANYLRTFSSLLRAILVDKRKNSLMANYHTDDLCSKSSYP